MNFRSIYKGDFARVNDNFIIKILWIRTNTNHTTAEHLGSYARQPKRLIACRLITGDFTYDISCLNGLRMTSIFQACTAKIHFHIHARSHAHTCIFILNKKNECSALEPHVKRLLTNDHRPNTKNFFINCYISGTPTIDSKFLFK